MADLLHSRELVLRRFSSRIDFGPCLLGGNLNLVVLRGHGRLDQLAIISAPDVYDQYENPTGTQRALKKKHAQECFEYAIKSPFVAPEEDPRFFPEVLLNVRDPRVIEIYELENPSSVLEVDSFSDSAELPSVVGLRVLVERLEFPKPLYKPQISRVDGNHRLYGADDYLAQMTDSDDEEPLVFPVVPFSLLIGLDDTPEAALFRDINGEHEGMETAHLDNLAVRLHDPNQLKSNPKTLPLWIAHELSKSGRAFEGVVFLGGSKRGVLRATGGKTPPVKLNALKSTIDYQIKNAPRTAYVLKDDPDALLELIDRYWRAVKEAFPTAWQNRADYILMQSIGLGGFAKFGGMLLDEAVEHERVSTEDFRRRLAAIDEELLRKSDERWKGIAGLAGAARVAEVLMDVSESDEAKKKGIVRQLRPSPDLDDVLKG